LDFGRCALGICVAAALTGCGGSQPPIGAPGAGSATLEKATGGSYLYVSNDYEDSVVLFSYDPKSMTANLVGQYGVNAEPVGSCSDAHGNVYVVAYSGYTSVITEFAFGTLTPMQTLDYAGDGRPTGCSVDPTTGDLAVTIGSNEYSTPAAVLIFTNGSGTPEQIDACDYNGTAGYDPHGNLWLECLMKGSSSILELPKGESSFQSVTFGHNLYYLGAIQWDGKYLDVSVALNNANYYTEDIYQTTISRSALKTKHTITFQRGPRGGGGRGCGNGLYFSQWAMVSKKPDDLPTTEATQLIAANSDCTRLPIWNYPAGGRPARSLRPPVKYRADYYPTGVTYVTQPEMGLH